MPTPSDSTEDLQLQRDGPIHTTCPPENDRSQEWRDQVSDRLGFEARDSARLDGEAPPQQHQESTENESPGPMAIINESAEAKESDPTIHMDVVDPTPPILVESPSSPSADEKDADNLQLPLSTSSALNVQYSSYYGIESSRFIQTHSSSMLRTGSKFRGTQQSDSQKYNVEVDIKTVDTSESFLCGYLRIEGLTPQHATLTTYFEGEIIGPKYTFQTRHPDWGATDREDMKHWARFPAWRPLAKQAKKSADFHYKNSTNRENMFMRWKEKFLVPDHRVKEITGASFEGFYYICFNQVEGSITGIYYHHKANEHTNKFQQLELKWVNDHGCFGAMEFR